VRMQNSTWLESQAKVAMSKLKVTNNTTLGDFNQWMELRPNIKSARLRRPNGDLASPTRGFRVFFDLTNGSPVMGGSKESLIEAIDSAVTHIEDLFPL
jgi:hypothetical protein